MIFQLLKKRVLRFLLGRVYATDQADRAVLVSAVDVAGAGTGGDGVPLAADRPVVKAVADPHRRVRNPILRTTDDPPHDFISLQVVSETERTDNTASCAASGYLSTTAPATVTAKRAPSSYQSKNPNSFLPFSGPIHSLRPKRNSHADGSLPASSACSISTI